MPYELGGRADKRGNRFETRWVIYQILKVLDEKLSDVILEALGNDEQGVDIWIGKTDGNREGQQCKGRNGSKEFWDYGTANAKGIFTNWKYQLDRDISNTVSLVSPLAFTLLEDLIQRAKNTSENPKNFYKNQVLNASKEFIAFFRNFCKVMELNPEHDLDLVKCISYLNRITYRQLPDTELKELILSKISYLLIGNEEEIYAAFIEWIIDGDILGRIINQSTIYSFLKEKSIYSKNLAADERIMPRLTELNHEYNTSFIPLKNGMIKRKEVSTCKKAIDTGNSIIIHGKAGRGKSGSTVEIVNYCKKQNIPYLAIKLDKRVPNGNADKWGKDLGLPASIAHCIHSIAKSERAVIILDQLDALRWTVAHSRDALLVCAQIINQVENLNIERKNKISIVFVCRTYDLDNDNNIRSLFKDNNPKEDSIQWKKIQVNELKDELVREITDKRYEHLTKKLKEILRIPSNLYIWQQLDPSKGYAECSTANHLISEWWRQLSDKCFEFGLKEDSLNQLKQKMVTQLEKRSKIFFPLSLLNEYKSSLEFLASNAFLIVQDNKVSFAHQSILDCFLAEQMLERYYDGEDIQSVVGSKEKQTPAKRYQVQMFMQNLLEFDSQDFINVGQEMFKSKHIRYFVKFIFLELLNQIDEPDQNIQEFIVNNCENKIYNDHLINNVIYSRPKYIRLLRKYGILETWFNNPSKKDTFFNLLTSMSPNYDTDDVAFIEKYAFNSQENDKKLSKCFIHDIDQDMDQLFELRLKFYDRYPQMTDMYFDFNLMLKNSEIRTIRLFAFLLKLKLKNTERNTYSHEDGFLDEDTEIIIKNGGKVLDILLPYVTTEEESSLFFRNWTGRDFHINTLERTCIYIIKKANDTIICENPEKFFERYKGKMGKGNVLFNEIILDGLRRLPVSYSDIVISYLISDLNSNIFDKTSGLGDELLLAKQILEKHSRYCSENTFNQLEKRVLNYLSPDAKDRYLYRINFNREKNGSTVFWSFWGDFQHEILDVLPYHRLNNEAKDLIRTLRRKFPSGTSLYKNSSMTGGWVHSPVAGKKLHDKKWIEIITNTKIAHRSHSNWNEVPGGIIDNSIDSFARSFSDAVSKEPERMINLVLKYHDKVLDVYVDSLFSGVAQSEDLNTLPLALLESMLLTFPHDSKSYRAGYICSLIQNRQNVNWSQGILDILKDIAINHKNPEIGKPNVTNNEDKEMRSLDMLLSNAINCTRGNASRSIANLIWNDDSLFIHFKDTIEKLTLDENPAVNLASLFALWPSYNIQRTWAAERIINLYERDYRYAGFHDTKNMLFLLHSEYRERVLKIIKSCYESEDEKLIELGAYCLSEMFIQKNEFVEVINNVNIMSEVQAKAILNMTINYFNKDEFNSSAKILICKFKESKLDLQFPISRLFYDNLIDLERDKDFLVEIMNSHLNRRTVHAFVRYLEKESKSIIDYKDIILSMSYHILQNNYIEDEKVWGIEVEISKLVIGLYDETSDSQISEIKDITRECLNIWDLMFEKQIGPIRSLSHELMER